jgi:PKD repeat protein
MGCAILPVADFVASNTSIQVGSSITFTNLSTGNPNSWTWVFEGGTPSTFNGQNPPAISYNTVGVFDVTLTVTNPSGQDVELKADYIQVFNTPPPPAANFTANVTTIFVGGSVNFSDLSTNGPTSWQWTFEGGTPATSTQQNPQNIVYNTAGTFDVTLVATNQYGSDTEVKADYITVQVIPPPQAAFTASVTTIFVGQTVTFTDQSTGNPTSWSWAFEGGTPGTSNQQNPAPVTYNTLGVFDVSLTVFNTNGSTTMTKTDYINVIQPADLDLVITEIMYNPPEAGNDILEFIEIYNNSSSPANLNGLYFAQGIEFAFPNQVLAPSAYYLICVNATAFQTGYNKTAVQWTSGALSNSGETLEIKDANGNTVDIVSFLDVEPWPTEPDGNGPSLTLCDPSSDNNDPANWFVSSNFAGLTPDGDSLFATPGEVCEFVGINEHHSTTTLSVYPNPTSGQFTINFSESDTWKTELFDLTGSLRYSRVFEGNSGVVQTQDLQKGIYMLKAVNGNSSKILTQKVIVN